MREIDLKKPGGSYIHALVLGAPKSGKTHFAASAPRPLFISDVAEGGYATLASMDPALWWDPSMPPTVWAIENAFQDHNAILGKLEAMKAQALQGGPEFPFSTLVIDPISIYADRVLAEMQMRASANKKETDGRQLYGDLANHLRVFVLRVHALPCHVLWLCHVKDGSVSLAGQTAEKLPAYMDFTWLCTNSAALGYEFHTAPYGAFSLLGGRWGIANNAGKRFGLPNPIIPSFKAIAQVMHLPQVPTSVAMPGYPEGATYKWPPEEG